MISPSNRSNAIKEYYFSLKLQEIELLNRKGFDVINLGIGNPDLPPPDAVIGELSKSIADSTAHGYQSYKGIKELRESFSLWYKRYFSVDLNPDKEILPLMGSKEGIMHISMAFVNPGESILIPNPGYPTYKAVAKIVGAKVIEYNLSETTNWFVDFDELEKLALDKVKLMWVNYPNMPTGQNATKKQFKKLIDFAVKHSILIVNDNPYSFILNSKPLSILAVPESYKVALELNSLSKSHNMAGFRIGMLAGNSSYLKSVLKIKSNMDSGMYKPLQLAATCALNQDNSWYQSNNSAYLKRRVLVEQLIDLVKGEYSKQQSGLFIWSKIPSSFTSSVAFSDYYLDKAKVFFTPGIVFGSNGEGYFRVSLCSTIETLKKAILRIQQIQR